MTHLSGQWLFHTAFHAVADTLFLILGLLSVRVVSGTRWDVHRRWLVPLVVESALSLAYRALLTAHPFLAVPQGRAVYALAETCLYMAILAGLCGMYLLWRTLRGMVAGAGPGTAPVSGHEEGVWPPPPSGTVP